MAHICAYGHLAADGQGMANKSAVRGIQEAMGRGAGLARSHGPFEHQPKHSEQIAAHAQEE